MKLFLTIFFVALGVACFGFDIYFVIKFVKNHNLGEGEVRIDKSLRKKLFLFVFLTGVFTIGSTLSLASYNGWVFLLGESLSCIFGSYLMGTAFVGLFTTFVIYYYRPDLNKVQRTNILSFMIICCPLLFIGVYMLLQGVGDHLVYPLVNGFIGGGNFFAHPGDGSIIAFYGILIVGGAIIVYFICDHYFYKKYHEHGILEPLLFFGFIPGILGARLWYCFVLETDYFLQNPEQILAIWNGGLAIQGGILGGFIGGVTYLLTKKKYLNIRWTLDIIVPTILIAQAIGRFGNFFNLEVHGNLVDASKWEFLPRFIFNNMAYSSTNGKAPEGMIYLPLFLIEALMNFAGYFIIRFAIGKPLKKRLALGDLSMCYLIWYGLTRVVLEPLRVGFTFKLGDSAAFGYLQSFITAGAMILVGILGIIAFHVYDYIRKRKGLPPRTLETI